MEFIEITRSVERLNIKLPSNRQAERLDECLQTFVGTSYVELINHLGGRMNSKSLGYIFDAMLSGNLEGEIFSRNNSIKEAIKKGSDFSIGGIACIELLRSTFENRKADVESILKNFKAFSDAILSGDGVFETIASNIESFGHSRVFTKKLLLAYFVSETTSMEDQQKLEAIIAAENIKDIARELFFLTEALQPRGRPFSIWSSYDEPLTFRPSLYSTAPLFTETVCPTPIAEAHVGAYLNGLLGSSLPDQVAGVMSLINVSRYRKWKYHTDIKKVLGLKLYALLQSDSTIEYEDSVYSKILGEKHTGFTVHSSSMAFPELSNSTLLRNETDRLTLPRFMSIDNAEIRSEKYLSPSLKKEMRNSLSLLTVNREGFHFNLCEKDVAGLPHVLRFLKYRESFPNSWDVNGEALALILATGVSDRCFIASSEIEKFVAQSEFSNDFLGMMLWSSMAINGRLSDDADYKFLRSVEKFVINLHAGDIISAFTSLSERHPVVAVSLIGSLTPRRLQKCYALIGSYSEVNATHRGLLEVAAKVTGDVDLIMQADQILLDEKLASVRAHIDSSRIYVEEALFDSWVKENVWPSLEMITKQIFLIIPGPRENLTTHEIAAFVKGGSDTLGRISAVIQELYLNNKLMVSYETFCRDHYFGVDSFLGRRIRHNATHGILLGQLDEISTRISSQNEQDEWEIENLYKEWKGQYVAAIDDLVNNLFRFESEDYPRGMLSARAEPDSEKFRSMATDVISQVITGSPVDVVLRALTSGCWAILDPELKKVRAYLRNDFTTSTMRLLDSTFRNASLPCQALQAELKATLLERIERLSSWFSPYNPSETSLSLHDLSHLIWSESEVAASAVALDISGDADKAIVVGGQSRILYDCLHVLLVNAAKHRYGYRNVSLKLSSGESDQSNTSELHVTVSSHLPTSGVVATQGEEKVSKMKRVLFEEESSKKSLIAHGYSGLRKLRYLMYRMDRESDIKLTWEDDTVSVGFSIPIEFARESDDVG